MKKSFKKLGYVFKRIGQMNYSAMFKRAKQVSEISGKFSLFIVIDMIYCGFKYAAGYEDYVLFEFYNLPKEKRATYITRGINNNLVKKLNYDKAVWEIFEDKRKFHKTFKEYIGRGWIDLGIATYEGFEEWIKSYEGVVIKPVDETCGKGIEKIYKKDFESIKNMYEYIIETGSVLVEEIIVQHKAIANIYDNSVNTIRMVSLLNNGEVHIPYCAMRIGNGFVVDNINYGGMAALIDVEKGVITKPGADKKGIIYEEHPISHTKIVGQKIPMWDECKVFIEKVATIVPELGYVGWDVALTEEGPILIEANHYPGHDIYQLPVHLDNGIGLLPVFREYVNI